MTYVAANPTAIPYSDGDCYSDCFNVDSTELLRCSRFPYGNKSCRDYYDVRMCWISV